MQEIFNFFFCFQRDIFVFFKPAIDVIRDFFQDLGAVAFEEDNGFAIVVLQKNFIKFFFAKKLQQIVKMFC